MNVDPTVTLSSILKITNTRTSVQFDGNLQDLKLLSNTAEFPTARRSLARKWQAYCSNIQFQFNEIQVQCNKIQVQFNEIQF